ncbi:MAG: trigger factor [Candidatus Puniceispirillum sp.]|nr:trigger factor [Candidatus Pelagibacter sp.]MBA4283455.1 trigger factor [Candidatus Puniceispirillum sp.]
MAQEMKTSSSLTQVFDLTISKENIDAMCDKLIAKKAVNFKMAGFRPGKVPLHLVRERFVHEVYHDAVEKLIQDECQNTIVKEKLKLADRPRYDVKSFDHGTDVSFQLIVDKMPEIQIDGYDEIAIQKLQYEVSDSELNESLEKLRNSIVKFKDVDAKDKVENQDRITVDVVVKSSNKKAKKQTFNDLVFIVSDEMHPMNIEMVKQLKEHKAGDTFTYESEVYSSAEKATLEVTFKKHEKPLKDPITDADIVEQTKQESIEKVKELLTAQLKSVGDREVFLYHKRVLFDKLFAQFAFDAPTRLVDSEFSLIWSRLLEEAQNQNDEELLKDLADESKLEELKVEYKDIAERRVKLGIIVGALAEKESINLSQDTIAQIIMNEARKYPGEERKVIQHFQKNPDQLKSLAAPYIEDATVNFVLSQIIAEPKKITIEDKKSLFTGILPGYDEENEEVKVEKKSAKEKKETSVEKNESDDVSKEKKKKTVKAKKED